MENITSKEVRDNLSDVLNKVAYSNQKFIITRSGKGVAVIISMEEWAMVEDMYQKIKVRNNA